MYKVKSLICQASLPSWWQRRSPSRSESLSSLIVSNEGTAPSSRLQRDLDLYERKCKLYFSKITGDGEARLNGKSELDILDPLLFWIAQEDCEEFQTDLASIAQDILAVPATSVPSERLFSISGILSQNRSSSILPDNLEKRVLIRANQYL